MVCPVSFAVEIVEIRAVVMCGNSYSTGVRLPSRGCHRWAACWSAAPTRDARARYPRDSPRLCRLLTWGCLAGTTPAVAVEAVGVDADLFDAYGLLRGGEVAAVQGVAGQVGQARLVGGMAVAGRGRR